MLDVRKEEIKRGLVTKDENVVIEVIKNETVIARIYPVKEGAVLKTCNKAKLINSSLQEITIKEENSS